MRSSLLCKPGQYGVISGQLQLYCRPLLLGLCLTGAFGWPHPASCLVSVMVFPNSAAQKTQGAGQDDSGRLKLLQSFISQNKLHEAVPMVTNYLKDHPDSWRAYQDLGYVLFRTGDFDASLKALCKSVKLNSKNPGAHVILGLVHAKMNRYDLAQTELERAAQLNPSSAETHFYLGRVYLSRSFLPLAKRELQMAIRLDPTYMKAYENLGLTMEALGDNAAALESDLYAILLNQERGINSEWPYFDLAKYYNRLNEPGKTIAYVQKALQKNSRSDAAYFEMAKAYRARGEWRQAAEALRQAIEINPSAAQYHYVLSYVYRKMGKLKESDEEVAAFRKCYFGAAGLTLKKADPGVATVRSSAPGR